MSRRQRYLLPVGAWLLLAGGVSTALAEPGTDPLASWNAGATKTALLEFVAKVTREGGPGFVATAERIAVFDQDGALWAEQPIYVQLTFALDRVRVLAPEHPEWKDTMPFKAALEGDLKAILPSSATASMEMLRATHTGMTTDEFRQIVTNWLATAKNPRFHCAYKDLVYQPMLELLVYLRANGFKTFIVSGSGAEFTRVFAEAVYGIPPEQVIGSRVKLKYVVRDGRPALFRLPEVTFIDDKDGKPVGIEEHIGRRPIAAFGNSDGDFQMLQWTTTGSGSRLGLIVHHDDADREWAYDRDSLVGRLDQALVEAPRNNWVVVSMKRDWKTVFKPIPAGLAPSRKASATPRAAGKE